MTYTTRRNLEAYISGYRVARYHVPQHYVPRRYAAPYRAAHQHQRAPEVRIRPDRAPGGFWRDIDGHSEFLPLGSPAGKRVLAALVVLGLAVPKHDGAMSRRNPKQPA